MEAGGRYRPAGCEPRSRTAIIVPHRAREHHLRLLLYHLHPFLQRQQLAYGIYVIHQVPPHTHTPQLSYKEAKATSKRSSSDVSWDNFNRQTVEHAAIPGTVRQLASPVLTLLRVFPRPNTP